MFILLLLSPSAYCSPDKPQVTCKNVFFFFLLCNLSQQEKLIVHYFKSPNRTPCIVINNKCDHKLSVQLLMCKRFVSDGEQNKF